MLAEAAKLEKKNRDGSLVRAGGLVEGHFKSNFADFNLDTFKEEVKKIFSGAEVKTINKAKKTATAKPPQTHHETTEQKDDSAQKKSWFK
ncbi:MAG: hypothetical protein HY279_02655 [Nitrospinae bacterium]|nr:hypothetical protein [Nitrospinota bacterium]